jgi:hypothetical protein
MKLSLKYSLNDEDVREIPFCTQEETFEDIRSNIRTKVDDHLNLLKAEVVKDEASKIITSSNITL